MIPLRINNSHPSGADSVTKSSVASKKLASQSREIRSCRGPGFSSVDSHIIKREGASVSRMNRRSAFRSVGASAQFTPPGRARRTFRGASLGRDAAPYRRPRFMALELAASFFRPPDRALSMNNGPTIGNAAFTRPARPARVTDWPSWPELLPGLLFSPAPAAAVSWLLSCDLLSPASG